MSELEKILNLAGSGGDESEVSCLVSGLDAVLDEAYDKAHDMDQSSLPPGVGQVFALLDAAGHLVDQLMDVLGVHDPDAHDDNKVGYSAGVLTSELLELAADKSSKPYGNVTYADPKNGKYPVDTAERAEAAWDYINHPEDAGKYPLNGVTLESVKARIRAACAKFGIKLSS